MKNKKKKILLTVPILIIIILTTLVLTKTEDLTKILGLVNPMDLKSSDVPYTNNSQSTVQGAIDELYTRANTWIDPSTIQTNSNGKMFASSKGIVFRYNGSTHFIKANNWSVEQNHIQQVFSDQTCYVESSRVTCNVYASLHCDVYSDGHVRCSDYSDYSSCDVYPDGTVECY